MTPELEPMRHRGLHCIRLDQRTVRSLVQGEWLVAHWLHPEMVIRLCGRWSTLKLEAVSVDPFGIKHWGWVGGSWVWRGGVQSVVSW